MAAQDTPEPITLSAAGAASFKARLAASNLSDSDKQMATGLVSFSLWMQRQLEKTKLSIKRLRKLFGVKTEKNSKNRGLTPPLSEGVDDEPSADDTHDITSSVRVERAEATTDSSSTTDSANTSSTPQRSPLRDPKQNHGCYGFADYAGCHDVLIAHADLQAGDNCPDCLSQDTMGRLYRIEPGVLIRLEGQPLIGGKRYQIEKLRCAVCGQLYSAEVPSAIAQSDKRAPSVAATLALGRYGMGLPFHRIEAWQAMHAIPMPDATAWDEVAKLADAVEPMYTCLQQLAGEGDTLYYDDTPNKILTPPSPPMSGEVITSTDQSPSNKTRKGVYTTAVIAQIEHIRITVFMTTECYAGEEIERLLAQRQSQQRLVTMCDASSMNIPGVVSDDLLSRWVLAFCLVHGRRHFYELLPSFDLECDFVLECIGKVYQVERHCQVEGYDPPARLVYHQLHSAPVMEGLWVWLTSKRACGDIEPNSGFGQAARYMLRHWEALTRFLHHPGVPIDNSLSERTLKLVIRHRRNSLFFQTSRGALVGDILMSLMHTAQQNGVNPVDYLVLLNQYADEMAKDPVLWLPWHVADRLSQKKALAA